MKNGCRGSVEETSDRKKELIIHFHKFLMNSCGSGSCSTTSLHKINLWDTFFPKINPNNKQIFLGRNYQFTA